MNRYGLAALLALASTLPLAPALAQGSGLVEYPDVLPILRGGSEGLHAWSAYPERAVSAREEGTAYVRATVTAGGVVSSVTVLRAPSDLLGEAAARAIRTASFTPAIHEGKNIEAWVGLAVHFTLKDSPAPEVRGEPAIEIEPYLVHGVWEMQGRVQYPRGALIRREEGTVIVRVAVSAVGLPLSAVVVRSRSPLLDAESVRVLMESRFVPGLRNGEPAEMAATIPVRYGIVPRRADTPAPPAQPGP